MVSGSISLRYSRFFSPFPHGTGSLSVSQEYLALADGAARFRQGFSGPALLRIPSLLLNIPLRGSHPLWPTFPNSSGLLIKLLKGLQPQHCRNNPGLGFFPFARHYLGNHFCFLLLQVLRCFSSLRSPPVGWPLLAGFPHSDICGSIRVANPRSFSQLATSFFASESQGIPHTPFLSCPSLKPDMLYYYYIPTWLYLQSIYYLVL